MNDRWTSQFQPYFFAGLIIVLAVSAIVLFFYLLVAVMVVGSALYVFAWLRRTFFPPTPTTRDENKTVTFEHGDY